MPLPVTISVAMIVIRIHVTPMIGSIVMEHVAPVKLLQHEIITFVVLELLMIRK